MKNSHDCIYLSTEDRKVYRHSWPHHPIARFMQILQLNPNVISTNDINNFEIMPNGTNSVFWQYVRVITEIQRMKTDTVQ